MWTLIHRDRLHTSQRSTHDVPCCKHAIDYGTAECCHNTKTDEHDGRHQLGVEDRRVWGLSLKTASDIIRVLVGVYGPWSDHHCCTPTHQCLSHTLTHVVPSVGSVPRDTNGNHCMKYTLCPHHCMSNCSVSHFHTHESLPLT